MVNSNKAKDSCNKFIDDYFKEPYLTYLSSVGIAPMRNLKGIYSLVTLLKDYKTVNGKLPIRPGRSDNLSDWCITIGLKEKVPLNLKLPSEYSGVKIFYHSEKI